MTQPKVVEGSDVDFEDSNAQADISSQPNTQGTQAAIGPSGLDSIPDEVAEFLAINFSTQYGIPTVNARHFAYTYVPEFSDSQLRFVQLERMHPEDAVEAIKRIMGPNYKHVNIADLVDDSKEEVDFPHSYFPESPRKMPSFRDKYTESPFVHLLRLPARARTLVGGAFYDKIKDAKRKFTIINDVETMFADTQNFGLQISTRDIVDYAVKIGIQDITPYIKLMGEMRKI